VKGNRVSIAGGNSRCPVRRGTVVRTRPKGKGLGKLTKERLKRNEHLFQKFPKNERISCVYETKNRKGIEQKKEKESRRQSSRKRRSMRVIKAQGVERKDRRILLHKKIHSRVEPALVIPWRETKFAGEKIRKKGSCHDRYGRRAEGKKNVTARSRSGRKNRVHVTVKKRYDAATG